jgi:hypothetical protein
MRILVEYQKTPEEREQMRAAIKAGLGSLSPVEIHEILHEAAHAMRSAKPATLTYTVKPENDLAVNDLFAPLSPEDPTEYNCEECDVPITIREANAFWDDGAPVGEYPALCDRCVDLPHMGGKDDA